MLKMCASSMMRNFSHTSLCSPDEFVEPSCRVQNPTLLIINFVKRIKSSLRNLWRRRRDSNPRYGIKPYTPLAGERLQPLGHFSEFSSSIKFLLITWLFASSLMRSLIRTSCAHPRGNRQHNNWT